MIKKHIKACRLLLLVLISVALLLTGGCGKEEKPGENAGHQDIANGSVTATQTDPVADNKNEDITVPEQEIEKMDYEKIYYNILGNYLKEQLGLEQYEEEISGYGCCAVDADSRVDAQIRGSMGLTYIYVRNDLHLERLSEEDRAILEECAKNWTGSAGTGTGKAGPNPDKPDEDVEDIAGEKAEEMVIRTFSNCITPEEITSEADRKVMTIYDMSAFDVDGSNQVTMDSLVLQIATQSEYDENDNIIDYNVEVEKEKKLYDLATRMEDEMEGLLGDTPIRVLVDYIK